MSGILSDFEIIRLTKNKSIIKLKYSNLNTYSCDEEGLNKIKRMVINNDKYLERYDKPIVLQSNLQKPLPNEDWNNYALQRLVDNDILDYNNIVIVYDTVFKDIITVRL